VKATRKKPWTDLVLKRSENCKCTVIFILYLQREKRLISVSFEIAVRERAWISNLDRKTKKKKLTSEALKTHSI